MASCLLRTCAPSYVWPSNECRATGPVTDFSFRSDAPSGHYQRHLTAVLILDVPLERAYTMQVPARQMDTIERTAFEIPVMPFHGTLAEELQTNPGLSFQLPESLENDEWTAQYHEHPIVCGATTGEQVWPLALYVDGVPFQKQDGLIAFYGYNLVSIQRHLLLVWRRSDMCSCGCLGWCSLHVIMRCLAWSFEALAAGQRPRVRHDGTPFIESEAFMAAQGATPLPKGCLVYLKCDWSEFVHPCGLPSWNSNFDPCPCSSASADELGEVGATSVVCGPYPDTTFDDYDRACADCEFKVVVNTRVDLPRLAGSLPHRRRGAPGEWPCRVTVFTPSNVRSATTARRSFMTSSSSAASSLRHENPGQALCLPTTTEVVCIQTQAMTEESSKT